MKTILLILNACFALLAPVQSQESRIWTYAKTGSTCEGILQWKSPDGTELQIKRNDNGRVITVQAAMLIEEDQKQVNAWQASEPVAPEATIEKVSPGSLPPDGSRQAAIQKKLDTIIIPRINFNEATLDEVTDFFRLRCAELDSAEIDSNKRGLNFAISQSPPSNPPRLNLKLENVPLAVALNSVADQIGMEIKINEYFVELKPIGAADTPEPKATLADTAAAAIQKKLDAIVIPRIDMEDKSLAEAVDFLRLRCSELDETEIVKSQKGVNIVITRPPQFDPPRLRGCLKNI